jgi:hypothetical protein
MSEITNPTGVSTPDNLYAGGFPEVRDTRTIPDGIAVKRGDILSDGYVPIPNNGNPDCIALEDVSATADIRVITVALTGEFNINALSVGNGPSAEAYVSKLRKLSIFVRHPAP